MGTGVENTVTSSYRSQPLCGQSLLAPRMTGQQPPSPQFFCRSSFFRSSLTSGSMETISQTMGLATNNTEGSAILIILTPGAYHAINSVFVMARASAISSDGVKTDPTFVAPGRTTFQQTIFGEYREPYSSPRSAPGRGPNCLRQPRTPMRNRRSSRTGASVNHSRPWTY